MPPEITASPVPEPAMSAQTTRRARVLAWADNGEIFIEPLGDGCGRCHEQGKKHCCEVSLTRLFRVRQPPLRAQNPVRARPGDTVLVTMPTARLARQASLAYLIPLLALIAGAATGHMLAGDTGAILGGGLALAAVWLCLPHLVTRHARGLENTGTLPQITEILSHTGGWTHD
jgi:positive regulator of sigma E activity